MGDTASSMTGALSVWLFLSCSRINNSVKYKWDPVWEENRRILYLSEDRDLRSNLNKVYSYFFSD